MLTCPVEQYRLVAAQATSLVCFLVAAAMSTDSASANAEIAPSIIGVMNSPAGYLSDAVLALCRYAIAGVDVARESRTPLRQSVRHNP